MQEKIILISIILLISISTNYSQKTLPNVSKNNLFLESTLFMLANFYSKNGVAPNFYLINFGYRISPNNIVSIELKFENHLPLGIP